MTVNKTSFRMGLMLIAGLLANTTPSTAAETDAAIESAIDKTFMVGTHLKDGTIRSESKNGQVILTGTVAHPYHRSLAKDTAEGVAGVRNVDDQLTVAGEIPVRDSDKWLDARANASLLFHRELNPALIILQVKDGTVTMRGYVLNQAQKELAAEYVSYVRGVKLVRDEMTIANKTVLRSQNAAIKMDDASITAQVKSAFRSNGLISDLATEVATVDGVVTVSGRVAKASERSLLTKLATDINGVSRVVNNTTMETPVVRN